MPIPADLLMRLQQAKQEHVLRWWDELATPQQADLARQLSRLDLEAIQRLYGLRHQKFTLPPREQVRPIPWLGADDARRTAWQRLGEQAYREGRIAILIVAGGQGTRLNFDQPKGIYPIGPVTKKSLFQIHTEKVLALRRRFARPIPLLMMTSPATHDDTLAFFEQHACFAFPREELLPFCQGTMPALDLASGKLLLEERDRLFASPDGHGGVLAALVKAGLLRDLRERGIEHIYYFQVDNPLIDVVDFAFIGQHLAARAKVSAKVVPKEKPEEKVGVFAEVDGRLTIIEYSDLPEAWARETDDAGRLQFWAGSPAIHLFETAFLERVAGSATALPWHVAVKKVPSLNDEGVRVEPHTENALKFEKFIFDVLPLAERWTLWPTSREREFMPLKNAVGPDSPATVQSGMSELAARWLRRAGVPVPTNHEGKYLFPIEISPLLALDADELAARLPQGLSLNGPTYLGEPADK